MTAERGAAAVLHGRHDLELAETEMATLLVSPGWPMGADIFRAHGPTWRDQERGHFSLGQLKVMSAVEHCRSAALGGHALRCSSCAQPQIAYNSCRNRHCPKCQSSAAQIGRAH